MFYWALIATICVPLALGAGYVLGKKKKVIAQLKEKKSEIITQILAKRDATKQDVIKILEEKF